MRLLRTMVLILFVGGVTVIAVSQEDPIDSPDEDSSTVVEVAGPEFFEGYTKNYNAEYFLAFELDGEWTETQPETYVATGDGPHTVLILLSGAVGGGSDFFEVEPGTMALDLIASAEVVVLEEGEEVVFPAFVLSSGMDFDLDLDADLGAESAALPAEIQIPLDGVIVWETKGYCWKEKTSSGVCGTRPNRACKLIVRYEDEDEVYEGECKNKSRYRVRKHQGETKIFTNLELSG